MTEQHATIRIVFTDPTGHCRLDTKVSIRPSEWKSWGFGPLRPMPEDWTQAMSDWKANNQQHVKRVMSLRELTETVFKLLMRAIKQKDYDYEGQENNHQ